ncbi:MAG: tRNA preQ1(34) S-adenosylmethionine ribosyltransferase-isomerase QueA, partial [Synechococcaceae bacterium WBA_2_066]|nr:tRNA preQ1(34) S-adenosylmethionine ribosyltransferase-isomerase QueA [Synechococcaceae bacterium WB9_2_069]NDE38907.1 tRNA preQ1(34) S-adenosylmethionine ribosyltransferase-isomerase QueA [Synechococcaceae bacterium WBA_2_066]
MEQLNQDQLLSSYNFELPVDAIAQRPMEPRHRARMLKVEGGSQGCSDLQVWDLAQQLHKGDLLVVNNTRVLRARLKARRANGGVVELLVLEPAALGGGQWICLAKPAKKLKAGDWLELQAQDQPPQCLQVLGCNEASGGRILQFPSECIDAAALEPLLVRYGSMPLPP